MNKIRGMIDRRGFLRALAALGILPLDVAERLSEGAPDLWEPSPSVHAATNERAWLEIDGSRYPLSSVSIEHNHAELTMDGPPPWDERKRWAYGRPSLSFDVSEWDREADAPLGRRKVNVCWPTANVEIKHAFVRTAQCFNHPSRPATIVVEVAA